MPKKSEIQELILQFAEENTPIIIKKVFLDKYPEIPYESFKSALSRLCKLGQANNEVWKGLCIIKPKDYFGEENVNVREYIDVIIRISGCGYYVSLYDAMVEHIPLYVKKDTTKYNVIVDKQGLMSFRTRTNPTLSLSYSNHIPSQYIIQKLTKYGTINVSSIELTAIDFISYCNTIGGLQESVEAMKALIPKLDFKRLNIDIFEFRTAANIQRLGYIIENVIGMPEMAQPLHDLLDVRYNKVYARNLLASALPATHTNINKRWQLDINVELNG